jgi:tetratricopeptide (TPR) repeat protein
LQRAVRINPDYAEAHGNLGNALAKSGNVSEGIAELQRAAALEPNDAWTITNLGITLVEAGRLEEAIQQFSRAVELSPTAYAHNNLGAAMMKTGRLPEAIDEFRAAIRLSPDFVQAYANLAQALVSIQKSDEAVATAQKGIEIARATKQDAAAEQLQEWLTNLPADTQHKGDAQTAPQPIRPAADP